MFNVFFPVTIKHIQLNFAELYYWHRIPDEKYIILEPSII